MNPPNLAAELAAEQDALRRKMRLTGLTVVGLLVGFAGWWVGIAWLSGGGYALAYLAGGGPAARDALAALRQGRLEIDLLMVLAALAAAAVGEPRDGAILLTLFSLAGTLEARAMGTTRRAVSALMRARPDTARVLDARGDEQVLPSESVVVGARLRVLPGERIPLDARVELGNSAVDQATVTGESLPVDKAPGDEVYAGTLNGYGMLTLIASKPASQSTLARMVALVTEAQAAKAPSERFSDWFGQRYTAWVLIGTAAALGGFLLFGLPVSEAFYRAATLLVVASPCAVVISVPAAVLSALAAGARRGVLFKGGGALEALAEVDTVAFDKTGTLTRGVMQVLEASPEGVDLATLKRLAGALEQASEHPIARAVVAWAHVGDRGIPEVAGARIEPGRGVLGEVEGRHVWAGNRRFATERGVAVAADSELVRSLDALEGRGLSVVLVGERDATGARLLGYLGVADEVRPQAAAALEALRRLGIQRLAMLTGDHPAVAHEVARGLGLPPEAVFAELLPADKLAQVERLARVGVVAFVGDGVNDAAGLASARVGIAMGAAGSDVALEVADIALLSDDLRRLPEALALARRARRIIRQNLIFALGVMVLMVGATVVGVLPLPLGVIGHEGGTLLVVANGLRLLAHKGDPAGRGGPAAAVRA